MNCLLLEGTLIKFQTITQFISHKNKIKEVNCSHGNIVSLVFIPFGCNVTKFNCSYQQIPLTSLKGIELCSNLEHFECDGNIIDSLEYLEKLTSLKYLSCKNNYITTISPLNNLIELHTLNISHNKLTTLEGLPVSDKLIGLPRTTRLLSIAIFAKNWV